MRAIIRTVISAGVLVGTTACAHGPRAVRCEIPATTPHSSLAWGPDRPPNRRGMGGRVIDIVTGRPIAGATISFDSPTRVVESDSSGEFAIALAPGRWYSVLVGKVGYQPVRDSVDVGGDGLHLFAALTPSHGIVDYVYSCKH